MAGRVDAGTGHNVADAEVERRWAASQENLVATAHLFDRITLIDNSGGVDQTLVVFDGDQVNVSITPVPSWGTQLAERIAAARSATRHGVSEREPPRPAGGL